MQTCLDTFAWFVQSCRYSNLWTPDDERNNRSKHVELYKNCRINTFKSASCWSVYVIDYDARYVQCQNTELSEEHTFPLSR